MEVPEQFIRWFWTMYADLYVVIVLNKCKSNKIEVKRGFMEGHCPSMAAFVVSLIPLMTALEDKLQGIEQGCLDFLTILLDEFICDIFTKGYESIHLDCVKK